MNCFENENIDRFCIVEKMQINFKLMKNIPKGKYEDRLKTDTKQFQQGIIIIITLLFNIYLLFVPFIRLFIF